MPRRYALAVEDFWYDYEVRHIPIGQFVLFFTILDETQSVWVIHARHGRQLTSPDDLPPDLEMLNEDG